MSDHTNSRFRRSPFPPAQSTSNQARIGRTRTRETPLRIKVFGVQMGGPSKEYMRQHAGFKLGKFALHIQAVDIRMRDESGPHGEPTVVCAMTILLDVGVVAIEKSGPEARAAFNHAIDMAERSVRKTRQRLRTRRRHPRPLSLEEE